MGRIIKPIEVQMQVGGMVAALERDREQLQEVLPIISDFSQEKELQGKAWTGMKEQLLAHRTVIRGCICMAEELMQEGRKLVMLCGLEELNEDELKLQIQEIEQIREKYKEAVRTYQNRLRDNTYEKTMGWYARSQIKTYEQLIKLTNEKIRILHRKLTNIDRIDRATRNLTDSLRQLMQNVKLGIQYLENSWDGSGFLPAGRRNMVWMSELNGVWEKRANDKKEFKTYGAQAGPWEIWENDTENRDRKRIQEIIHKYSEYKKLDEDTIPLLLKKIDSEGCGYVAFANILVDKYRKKEDEFEKKFGFPLYIEDEEGNKRVNFESVIVDLYCATDNHNQDGILWWKKDVYDKNEDISLTTGAGTSQQQREYRFENYMEDHGVTIKIENKYCTYDTVYEKCKKYIDEGKAVIISTHPIMLYDINGNSAKDMDGGHAMTVTGVTEEGWIEVSSWGKFYYIKNNDVSFEGKCKKECAKDAYIKIQVISF